MIVRYAIGTRARVSECEFISIDHLCTERPNRPTEATVRGVWHIARVPRHVV